MSNLGDDLPQQVDLRQVIRKLKHIVSIELLRMFNEAKVHHQLDKLFLGELMIIQFVKHCDLIKLGCEGFE